jgi:N-methylhydantoinase A
VAEYEERFGRSLGQLAVECVSWRVRVVAPPSVDDVRFDKSAVQAHDPKIETRPAYFQEKGKFVNTPVYSRSSLKAGMKIEGPALI